MLLAGINIGRSGSLGKFPVLVTMLFLSVGLLPEQCAGLKCYESKRSEKGNAPKKDFVEKDCSNPTDHCFSGYGGFKSYSKWGCVSMELTECLKKQEYAFGCHDFGVEELSTGKLEPCKDTIIKQVTVGGSFRAEDEKGSKDSKAYRVCVCNSDLCNKDGMDEEAAGKTSGAKSGRPDFTMAMLTLISGVVAVGSSRLGGSFTGA